VLGGGLEASALDVARFGMKLMDGDILTPTSLHRLWNAPDGRSDYAYGWNTNFDTCTAVVAKNGGQPGANSYVRLYPTRGIAIAVLTNRWNGGHSTMTLGREIGKIMLEEECQYAEEELLKNRGFETNDAGHVAKARFWQGFALDGDRRIVDRHLKIARSGKASFRFTGEGPFLSWIRQDTNNIGIEAGDRLILSGWVRANGTTTTPRLSVELNYDDGSNGQFLLEANTGTYPYRKFVKEFVAAKPANSLHTVIAVMEGQGSFHVDDVSLMLVREGGSSAGVVALPPAPGEATGANADANPAQLRK
jgi:hypothetical protein